MCGQWEVLRMYRWRLLWVLCGQIVTFPQWKEDKVCLKSCKKSLGEIISEIGHCVSQLLPLNLSATIKYFNLTILNKDVYFFCCVTMEQVRTWMSLSGVHPSTKAQQSTWIESSCNTFPNPYLDLHQNWMCSAPIIILFLFPPSFMEIHSVVVALSYL